MLWRFEDFVLDSETRQLLRSGTEVHLSPKAFRLLELLLQNQPRAMSKTELYEALWPATFVTESNLAGLIRELRDALNDRNRLEGLIRTVHRFGYAFRGTPARASLWRVQWDGREIPLPEGETVLGRDPDATIRVDDPTVSRHHARIIVNGENATIEDLRSKNGTRVSGHIVIDALLLSDGDQVELGTVKLTVRSRPETNSTISMTDLRR